MLRILLSGLLATTLTLTSFSQTQEATKSETGFVSLFNGTDLSGWDGDKRFWRVEDGSIIGQTTDEQNRKASGIFAFQLHSGPPMQIKIKNVRVRKL